MEDEVVAYEQEPPEIDLFEDVVRIFLFDSSF